MDNKNSSILATEEAARKDRFSSEEGKENSSKKKKKQSWAILNYIRKRPKNILGFFLLVITSKLCAHYFIYPTKLNNGGRKFSQTELLDMIWMDPSEKPRVYKEWDAPLSYYIENIFLEEIWLFIPITIIFLFLTWYFSDKIKAK